MEVKFEPVSDKLICKPVAQDTMSSGGIMLPELDDQKTLKGEVIASGPGFWAAPGLFVETTCKPGDIITFQRFAAQVMEVDDEEYQVVQERDILCKIKK